MRRKFPHKGDHRRKCLGDGSRDVALESVYVRTCVRWSTSDKVIPALDLPALDLSVTVLFVPASDSSYDGHQEEHRPIARHSPLRRSLRS